MFHLKVNYLPICFYTGLAIMLSVSTRDIYLFKDMGVGTYIYCDTLSLTLDLKSNYLNCLPYISYHFISKNLVLDQLIISLLIYFSLFSSLVCFVLFWYC